jgi:hypothetical protein
VELLAALQHVDELRDPSRSDRRPLGVLEALLHLL